VDEPLAEFPVVPGNSSTYQPVGPSERSSINGYSW
jgi:hypothetical protein